MIKSSFFFYSAYHDDRQSGYLTGRRTDGQAHNRLIVGYFEKTSYYFEQG